jgi:hypothetical protein
MRARSRWPTSCATSTRRWSGTRSASTCSSTARAPTVPDSIVRLRTSSTLRSLAPCSRISYCHAPAYICRLPLTRRGVHSTADARDGLSGAAGAAEQERQHGYGLEAPDSVHRCAATSLVLADQANGRMVLTGEWVAAGANDICHACQSMNNVRCSVLCAHDMIDRSVLPAAA